MRIFIVIFAALLLAACGTAPVIQTKVQTVEVKVKEPCIADAPLRPAYRFGKGAKPSDKEQAKILAGDFEAADRYARAWEAAASACIIGTPPQ